MAWNRPERVALFLVYALGSNAVTKPVHADDKDVCIASSEDGQRLRADGKLTAARAKFLACAQYSCPPLVRTDCSTWLAELDSALPSIVVVARDARGADVASSSVAVDAGPAVPIDGKPLLLDPGQHTLEVTSADARIAKADVLVATGEKNRVVVVTFAAPEEAPTPTPTIVAKASPPPAVTNEKRIGASVWIAGGIGVAALGAATIFGLSAISSRNNLRDTCAPHCADDDIDAVKRKRLSADVSLGVSLISFGVATLLYFQSGNSNSDAAPSSSTVSVSTTKTSARLDFGFRF